VLRLLVRTFDVAAPVERAWAHLPRVERWPTWAKHIRSVERSGPAELGPGSEGAIRLANGIRSRFRMTDWEPGRRWAWTGRFLWLRVFYDHRFEAIPGGTRITFDVHGGGVGAGVLGPLFAGIYAKNLDAAIPNLVAELASER
jgi:hypothetical protein